MRSAVFGRKKGCIFALVILASSGLIEIFAGVAQGMPLSWAFAALVLGFLLTKRFLLAALALYKSVLRTKAHVSIVVQPEKKAEQNRKQGRSKPSPSDEILDDRVNPIYTERDPFGEFID